MIESQDKDVLDTHLLNAPVNIANPHPTAECAVILRMK